MTLESRTNRNKYIGNGSTKAFNFTFKIWKKNQVKVFVGNGETETDMTQHVAVEITSTGGTVTFSSAPKNGQIIVIRRDMPYIQEDDYRNGTRFDAEEIEDRLDQDCAERQDLLLGIDRCIKLPETAEGGADLVAMLMQARHDVLWALEQAGDVTGATLVTAWGTTAARALQHRFADIVNVRDFGAVGDGVTDDTAAIQAAFDFCGTASVAWFPPGTYLVSQVQCSCSIIGSGINSSIVKGDGTQDNVILWTAEYDFREFYGIKIIVGAGQTGIRCEGRGRIVMHDFYIYLTQGGKGIATHPWRVRSKYVVASHFIIWSGNTTVDSYGLYLTGASDSVFADFEIMRCKKAIFIADSTSYLALSNAHLYCGAFSGSPVEWWNGTVGIEINSSCTMDITNLYIDTTCVAIGLDATRAGLINIKNFMYWDDAGYPEGVNKTTLFLAKTFYAATKINVDGGRIGVHYNCNSLYNTKGMVSFRKTKISVAQDFDGDFDPANNALPKSSDYEDTRIVSTVYGLGFTPIAFIRVQYVGFVKLCVSDTGGTMGILTVAPGPIFKWEAIDGTNHRLWYTYDSTTKVVTLYLEHYETRLVYIDIIYSGETCYLFRHDIMELMDVKVAYEPEKLDNSDGLTNIPVYSDESTIVEGE